MNDKSLLSLAPEVKAPSPDLYWTAAIRLMKLGGLGLLVGTLLYFLQKVFTDWGWLAAADAIVFLFVGGFGLGGAVFGVTAWRSWSMIEEARQEYTLDAANARQVRSRAVSVIVMGDKNKIYTAPVTNNKDARQIVLKTPASYKSVAPAPQRDALYATMEETREMIARGETYAPFAPLPAPAEVVDGALQEVAPNVEQMEPDYLTWMISTMLETGELSRAWWLKYNDPAGNPVSRAIWEAVIDALYTVKAITGDRSAKQKKFVITELDEILGLLGQHYPNGIVLTDGGFGMGNGNGIA